MTAAEITDYLGWERRRVNMCITTAREDHGTKFFRITSYRRQQGHGGREAPVYGVGPQKDAPRPVMNSPEDERARKKRYRDRNRAVINLRNRARRSKTVTNPFEQLIRRAA